MSKMIIKNKEGETTHVNVGTWEGEVHFLAKDKQEAMRNHVFTFEDMEEADADSGDGLIIDLMNEATSEDEIRFNLCMQLDIFSEADVIIELL